MGPGEEEQGFSGQIDDVGSGDTGLADQTYDTGDYGVETDSGDLPNEYIPIMPDDVSATSQESEAQALAGGAKTITFSLRNDQFTDLINVAVVDDSTGQSVGTHVLNRDDSVDISIVADSWGNGKASWAFWTTNGSVSSNKSNSKISDGDECTLG